MRTNGPDIRVGHGYDIHQLVHDRPLVLGGVHVPSDCGATGHSDADVLFHAIVDAMLGALATGDIGRHFPDSDPKLKDANSKIFVQQTVDLARTQGWELVNVDATVLLEQPKLAAHSSSIQRSVAQSLDVSTTRVSIKAASNEGMDAVGEGRAIACHAMVLLSRNHR